MNFIWYLILIVLGLIVVLGIVYLLLLSKLKNINKKLYRYEEETFLNNEKNVLIIYQPSRHKTTTKIKEIIKDEIIKKGYGAKIQTLSPNNEKYSEYKYTIFITPVYFGEVNEEIINKVSNNKIKNLIIVYNGLNAESSNEDMLLSKKCLSKYSKIKLHTSDIENVREFINKEVL